MTHAYRSIDVLVRGGDLRVGVWEPADTPDAPTVLALHGITASHRTWQLVAPRLPGVRVVAPDLRGRGRSNGLPPPYGMATHADDAATVLDQLGVRRATVVGHSMGGFATVVFHARHPERAAGVVLVDGGLPAQVPDGMTVAQVTSALLGPAAARLRQEFADRESYAAFWRAHPAFTAEWNDAIADYADYDLTGTPPHLRPATSPDVLEADAPALYGEPGYAEALRTLPTPTRLLAAPRGLLNDDHGSAVFEAITAWQRELPMLRVTLVPDVNHYTVLLVDRGADAVADAVRAAIPIG